MASVKISVKEELNDEFETPVLGFDDRAQLGGHPATFPDLASNALEKELSDRNLLSSHLEVYVEEELVVDLEAASSDGDAIFESFERCSFLLPSLHEFY